MKLLIKKTCGNASAEKQREDVTNVALTSYFGMAFDRHQGEGIKLLGVLDNTPAQNTGLRKGDIILEVENISFRDYGPKPEAFSNIINDLPPDKPLSFLIERERKRFEVWIKPLKVNEEQLAAYTDKIHGKIR